MYKRILSIILVGLIFLAACGSPAAPAPQPGPGAQQEQPAATTTDTAAQDADVDVQGGDLAAQEEGETRIVIDHNNDEIEIPLSVERLVIISPWPLPSVYALFVGSGERIVGVHESIRGAAEFSFLPRIAPEIAYAETGFVYGGLADINIEELLNLDPCLVFISAGNDAQRDIMQLAGIPAVAFSTTIAQWNTIETVNYWVELLRDIFGDEVKADEITGFGREVESMVLERISTIPEEDRPRALILMRYSEHEMQTTGNRHFGDYWLRTSGAINVAGGIDMGGYNISMEQVLEWNPEMIFITNFSPVLVEDFEGGFVFDDDWRSVAAYQEGRIYKFPMGMYRWIPPSSDAALTLLWMAQTTHPELFADIDLYQEIRDFYLRFYNIELTDADIYLMMNPPRETATGA